jgi:hypothetical protein
MADNISLTDELRRQHAAESNGSKAARDWRARSEEDDGQSAEATAEEAETNTAAFGFYRGVKERATYLEFQPLKGPAVAAGYAWLPSPRFLAGGDDKGRGQAIVLEYLTGLKVTIRGRNLRPCFERILKMQVFRISEMGEEADHYLTEDAAVVYAIEVVELVAG